LIPLLANSVYAAGTIAGHTYAEARYGWRYELEAALQDHDISVISPMRDKDDLATTSGPLDAHDGSSTTLSSAQAIVQRDYYDVARCALVFAYLLHAPRVSIGTMFELAWAFQSRKPVVIVADEGGLHDHPFIRQAGFFVPDMATGIEVTLSILGTGL
jgi:nucleoside 2-deoxyribosyltransferase